MAATNINQWKNTSSVLQWFKKLPNKHDSTFISFDVVQFYPSITDNLLRRALDFASNYATISAEDRHTIIQVKQSLPFNNNTPWQKRNSNTLFDVTMGSYDGAETCELVGCYFLSQLTQIPDIDIGLYRDDGLVVLNQTPQKIENVKKEICRIFALNNLRITIKANKKIVHFLDVTLDLTTGRFKPYSQTSNYPSLCAQQIKQPPNIIRNIPEAINNRLSEISCTPPAPLYQEALRRSGYAYNLKYNPTLQRPPNQDRRRRNIIWFNPPFNRNVHQLN